MADAATGADPLAGQPVFALLPDAVRTLVIASFEPVSYGFGEVIVREGESADAFYVITDGLARVVRLLGDGNEVALGTLGRGDCFGETALVTGGARTATVRASRAVQALRLHASVFLGLVRAHPEVREAFEALARTHLLWDFLRRNPAFSRLSDAGFARFVAAFEPVDVEPGAIVIREGEPPGPMFVVVEGRLGVQTTEAGEINQVGAGDVVGEASLFQDAPRRATVAALETSRLLCLPVVTFHDLLETEPAFRDELALRVRQYDYQAQARLPVDIAEEILPADATVGEIPLDFDDSGAPPTGRDEPPLRWMRRRFPIVYQLDEADCGAACLAMICRAFGRPVPISRIRDIAGTSTSGTTLSGITRAAESLGLAARSMRISPSRLDQLPTPAIVHWQGNHWVVAYRVERGHVRIADPARGLRRVRRGDFLQHWSGFASLLAYTPAFEQTPTERGSAAWLRPFLRPHRRLLVGAVVLALVAACLELLLPILTQRVIDDVVPKGQVDQLWPIVAVIVAVMLCLTAATGLQRYLLSKVAVRFDIATLDFLTGRLLDLPMRYFSARRTGDLERRLAGARNVRQFVVDSGVQILTAVTQLAAAIVLMIIYSPLLATIYIAIAPAYAWLMWFSARRLRPVYDNLEDSYGRYAAGQVDAIRGIETVKALAAEQQLRDLMLGRFRALSERVFRSQFLVLAYDGALQLVSFATVALFLVVGTIQVIHGTLTLGEFVAFNAIVALTIAPLMGVLMLWDHYQIVRVLLGRLDDVLDQEPEQGADHSHLSQVETLGGAVELQNVSFGYGEMLTPILSGINLRLRPGETVAVVGRSGSGKTTLIKLLAGLLEPTSGAITYDGQDMRTLDYRSLRRRLGYVLQDTYLFDDTIAGNIAFGDPQPDPQQLDRAARAAAALEFIQRLPLGYQTRVGESGMRLSGGQQQRIAIARALYHQPPILLLDEATSALDTESERAVKRSLDELLVGRTSVIIAHRLSTVRDADRIIVLDNGRIVEQGTHAELLERDGLYYYLASQQISE
jgi:ABC-type bacteriocin/lantibiotic exporter with double-glycine peptidase domain/CRP-like cAMP-binding protein